jgi:hypothetical protein
MNHPVLAIFALAASMLVFAWSLAEGIDAQMRIDATQHKHRGQIWQTANTSNN